jgi:hypothetical protein
VRRSWSRIRVSSQMNDEDDYEPYYDSHDDWVRGICYCLMLEPTSSPTWWLKDWRAVFTLMHSRDFGSEPKDCIECLFCNHWLILLCPTGAGRFLRPVRFRIR